MLGFALVCTKNLGNFCCRRALLLPSMEPVKPSVRVLGFEGKSCIIDNVDVERQCVIDHGRPGAGAAAEAREASSRWPVADDLQRDSVSPEDAGCLAGVFGFFYLAHFL